MNMDDLRKKTASDLKKIIAEKEAELREFRFGMAGAGKKDTHIPRAARQAIARAKTILNEPKEEVTNEEK